MTAPTLLCPCGSPATHLDLDEAATGWGCRVPAFHSRTGLPLAAVTDGGHERRCQTTNRAGDVQCLLPDQHEEPVHIGRPVRGGLRSWRAGR